MRSFSSLLSLVLVSVLSTITVSALDLPAPFCNGIDLRREWRSLTTTQKQAYITSVQCLQSLPAIRNGTAAVTRFDEFQLVHIDMTPDIHVVGHFLPWHRNIVTLYTNALRDECGYVGPTPYWDWTIDADGPLPMEEWPIFDPVTGFGGDGVPGTFTLPPDPEGVNAASRLRMQPGQWKGCVQDGPFANHTVNLGPHVQAVPHCLVRGFNETGFRHTITSESVDRSMAKTTFAEFATDFEVLTSGFHPGGHFIVGGELGDPYSSPGDPLFYLHHANVDRLWWKWQVTDPINRLYQIGGFTTAFPSGTTPTTIDFNMSFDGLGPDLTVKDTMNTLLEPNCYLYLG